VGVSVCTRAWRSPWAVGGHRPEAGGQAYAAVRLVRAQSTLQCRAGAGGDRAAGPAGQEEVDGVHRVTAPHRLEGHTTDGDVLVAAQRLLRAGASGFLLKDTEPADLLQAIEVVARGEALLSPAVTRTLIGEFVSRPPDRATPPGLECLTRRGRAVTALAARGLTNEEIAAHMVISPFTAKTHISRAMTKLGARDRAQLVVFAYESGLVTAREPRQP
jgi:DNA-binding CsgD family transcriptional regulator